MDQRKPPENQEEKPGLKKTINTFFRWILYVALFLALCAFLSWLYSRYENHLDLTYKAGDLDCQNHSYNKQLCSSKFGSLYIRQVERENRRLSISWVTFDDEEKSLRYNYRAKWFEECVEGTEIVLSKKYSNGDPHRLKCEDNTLSVGVSGLSTRRVEYDEFGFKVDHRYGDVDYSLLERKVALARAKSVD